MLSRCVCECQSLKQVWLDYTRLQANSEAMSLALERICAAVPRGSRVLDCHAGGALHAPSTPRLPAAFAESMSDVCHTDVQTLRVVAVRLFRSHGLQAASKVA